MSCFTVRLTLKCCIKFGAVSSFHTHRGDNHDVITSICIRATLSFGE